jgi:hypothetical protein
MLMPPNLGGLSSEPLQAIFPSPSVSGGCGGDEYSTLFNMLIRLRLFDPVQATIDCLYHLHEIDTALIIAGYLVT